MPYRAQRGGVFGSGLYPQQRQGNQAAEIIDAVTRGATTLIQGAYARAQKRREQALQDQEIARRDRAEQRQVEQDAFNRDMAVRKEAREAEAQQRADAAAGYTPGHTEEKETVEPGSVSTNGLFGAPGKVSGPSIKKTRLTIPGALDYTRSTAYQARRQQHEIHETERGEHIQDSETIHQSNRKFDASNPIARSSGSGSGTSDSPTVHASAAVRAQLSEVNQRIRALEAQKVKLAPATYTDKNGQTQSVGGNPAEAAKVDTQLAPLYARRDSLSAVNDRISKKMTDNSGVGGTIKGAMAGKRQQADRVVVKPTISQAEAAELRKSGFSMAQITAKYSIK